MRNVKPDEETGWGGGRGGYREGTRDRGGETQKAVLELELSTPQGRLGTQKQTFSAQSK